MREVRKEERGWRREEGGGRREGGKEEKEKEETRGDRITRTPYLGYGEVCVCTRRMVRVV